MNEQNKPLVDIVTLSKSNYDNIKATNIRAGMLLDRLLGAMTIDIMSDEIHLDVNRVLGTIEILYPETYKKKVSTLKTLRAKQLLKTERAVSE